MRLASNFDVPVSGDDRVARHQLAFRFRPRASAGDYEFCPLASTRRARTGRRGAGRHAGRRAHRRTHSGGAWAVSPSVEEASGTLTAATPSVNLELVDIDAGETLVVYVEAISGNLVPRLALRDYGGKALQASNQDGQGPQARAIFSTR